MASPRSFDRLTIVTPQWGEDESESIAVIRLVAGALARNFRVDVIHLDPLASKPSTFRDSVFDVHRFPVVLPDRQQEALLGLALGLDLQETSLPEEFRARLDERSGVSGDVLACIDELNPKVVLLVGCAHPYDVRRLRATRDARIIFMPLGERVPLARDGTVTTIMEIADLVIASDPGELRRLQKTFPARAGAIVALDLALSVNRSATVDTLFGVRFFQPFVLVIRSFGSGPGAPNGSVTHAIVTSVAGTVSRDQVPERHWRTTDDVTPEVLPISVAEVDADRWMLCDNINMLPLPVNPSRVNLWRLMAHALFTIDLRPATVFGREAIESMMFDSPVIVPDDSAAMEHVRAANAGLWYRNNGELLDAVRVLSDRSIRERFAGTGRAYVDAHHSNLDDFVERINGLFGAAPANEVSR